MGILLYGKLSWSHIIVTTLKMVIYYNDMYYYYLYFIMKKETIDTNLKYYVTGNMNLIKNNKYLISLL